MKRYGYKPDTFDPRDFKIGALLASKWGLSRPDQYDLVKYVDHVNNQTSTSSCVGQAGTMAVMIAGHAMGIQVPHLSAIAGYTLARGMSMTSPDEPLVDDGAMPRNFFKSANQFGVIAESRWPFQESLVNQKLPFDLFEAGSVARVGGYYRIDTWGAIRCEDIRRAIANGHPVTFAMEVDDSYEELSGSHVYNGRTGKSLGGHYQCIVGYRKDAFLVLNSWGTGWGDRGYAWISDKHMSLDECTDFYAVTTAPDGVR